MMTDAGQHQPERAGRQPGDIVSVIVPTRQASRTLELCLRSIVAQEHANLELVVIDNGSTDDTVAIAEQYADLVLQGGPERSSQRNLGVAATSGDWILWIDADMILPPETVALALAVARREGAEAVSIPELSVGPGYWTSVRSLERTCYLDDPDMYYPRLIRRRLFDEVGGFDELMAGPEDVDLRRRMKAHGAVFAHSDGVHILHDEGRLTMRTIMSKRVYYGRSLPEFANRNPGALTEQGGQTLSSFVRHRSRLTSRPGLAVGIVWMRAWEIVAYSYGYASGRWSARG